MEPIRINISRERLAEVCREFEVIELALFGSAVRGDARDDSDIDVLVSFAPAARVGFLRLAALQRRLEAVFGRRVDVVPRGGLKPAIRDEILAQAHVLYAA